MIKDVPNLLKIYIVGFFFEEIFFGWGAITVIVNEMTGSSHSNLCWMAPINIISMRYILKSAKSFERHAIYENAQIMRLYGLFWIIGLFDDDTFTEASHLRFEIAFDAMSLINFTFLFGLDILILLTYLRFCLKLSKRAVDKVTTTIQEDFYRRGNSA